MSEQDKLVHCEYCRIQIKNTKEFDLKGEVVCVGCKKWNIILATPTNKPSVEEKSSPMAVSSYGLHEKYFQDG